MSSALEGVGVHVKTYPVVDKESLLIAFKLISEYHKHVEGEKTFPILHISAHGGENGIELTDKEFINWDELGDFLVPFNEATGDVSLIGMSTCYGFHGSQMAWRLKGLPFYALVGPVEKVNWDDSKVAFVIFYHLVARRNWEVEDAVFAMNLAAGVPRGTFKAKWGEEVQLKFHHEVGEALEKRLAQRLGK